MANNWFDRDDEGASTWASITVEDTSPTADSPAVTYQVYDFQAVIADSVTVFYDVDSTVGQITGGATFPFASATSDAVSLFNVLNSSVEKDLVTSYSMRQEIDTQAYVTWRVLTGVEVDQEITYGLGGSVYGSEEPEIIYRVLIGAEQDSSQAYVVAGEVLADKSGSYNITTTPLTATSFTQLTYNVLEGVERDTGCTYTVMNQIEKDYEGVFYVFGEVLKDASTAFDVSGSVTSDIDLSYNVLSYTQVNKDYQFAYTINSEIIIVPNVVGMPVSLAQTTIAGAGLTVGTVEYITLQ